MMGIEPKAIVGSLDNNRVIFLFRCSTRWPVTVLDSSMCSWELARRALSCGQFALMKSAARSAMASTVRLRFARTVSGMIDASMIRSPSTP